MAIAIVGELVVARGELLEALGRDVGEIAREFRVFREDHRPPCHEAVDQRLLPHFFLKNPNPNERGRECPRERGRKFRERIFCVVKIW